MSSYTESEGAIDEDHYDGDKSSGSKAAKCVPQSLQRDMADMVLLVVLYAVQGIPLGLTFGSVPFLLQQNASYTELGIFSFAAYPYSLKLLWSPIVDTFFSNAVGRRKSWIIPMQLSAGILLLCMSGYVESSLAAGAVGIWTISFVFFLLILLAATQDIAVDGWAVSLLNKANASYAATCQTVGLNLGYFMSFTIFLALNSAQFCNKYLRFVPSEEPFLDVGTYLQLCGYAYIAVTFWLIIAKKEKPFFPQLGTDNSLAGAYGALFKLACRPEIVDLVLVMLTCKIGFAAAENVTALELLGKGFKKEDLAIFVVLDFPLQIFYAIVAGKMASGRDPLWIWLLGFQGRLLVSFLGTFLILWYPTGTADVPMWYYLTVLAMTLLTSAMSTMMFVSQGGFFARISDSNIGGTYLTLLNTVSNLGGTWPKFPVLFLMDFFESTACIGSDGVNHGVADCAEESGGSLCAERYGGECTTENNGFYYVNVLCVLVGVATFFWIKKKMARLQSLPSSVWNVDASDNGELLAREGTTPALRRLRSSGRSRRSSRTFLVQTSFVEDSPQ